MDIEQVRDYCLSKPHVEETTPFGPHNLVFKIGGKIFGLLSLDQPEVQRINLKCDTERVEELRANYYYIIPGYHMNKKHWNTIMLEADVDIKLVRSLIDHSYELVYNALPKSVKTLLDDTH